MDTDPQAPQQAPEAPDKEKMDQIRRRRLEKLGGPSTPKVDDGKDAAGSSATPLSESIEKSAPIEAPKPKIHINKVPTPSTTPLPEASTRSASGTHKGIVRDPSTVRNLKRQRAESDGQSTPKPAPRRAPAVPVDEPIEQYEHRILSGIFRITLDPQEKADSSNHPLIYLPNLRQELEADGAPLRLTKETLDGAIIEAGTKIPHKKSVLDYLLPCWKRVTKAMKELRGYASAKDVVLKEAKRMCMSNIIFACEFPELFGREPQEATDSLMPHLLLEGTEDRGVCPEFLTEIAQRMDEDDTAKSVLTKATARLSQSLASMTMSNNYKGHINALKAMCQFPKILDAIAQDPLFQMATSAPAIERLTILGPFFRISPLQAEVTKEYFAGPKTMDKRRILTAQEALRLTLQNHQSDLRDITNSFVRASVTTRNKILDWFAYIVNSNHKRRAMRPDPTTLSSDGFMINVTVVMDYLCEPFMDTTFSKVDRIDVNYLRHKPRVEIKDETKLNADQNASDEFYKIERPGTSNFISEVFFLNLAAHHYGSEATNGMLKTLDKDIKYLGERITALEAERPKFVHSPANMARFEVQLKKFNDVLEKSMSLKYAVEGVLFDKVMQAKSLMFMRVVAVWLLRIASESDYTPDKTIRLPLPDEQPLVFRNLPEYVLEDIVGNFNFIFRYIPEIMISAVGDEVIALCITFLTNSDYIKNPYLKAKLVSLLYHGTYPIYHRTKGVLSDALTGTKFANDHLLHALMKFYIEVESTGTHTQFYDKFNIRYEIFQVIKCIWSNDIYRQRLTQESKLNTDFFLRFVNLLLNDVTYVLDEALTKFPKIHDLQAQLSAMPSTLTPEERTTKEEELQTAEGQAQSYMQLTNETVSMMKLFTKTLSNSFTMSEIVDRVAAMVDYTLDTLVGPKCNNLKVEDPKKYHFNPKTLLCEFIAIYLNLGVSDNFVQAVARDGRSYKPENFANATRIVTRLSLISAEELAAWEALKVKFQAVKDQDDQDDDDLGEIPDEFLDPLLATLMIDPVILPMSKTVIDRATIRSHLLSDQTDPFNRSPLKIEDVIPDSELKAKIDTWRSEMRQKAKAERDAEMDTTAG